MSLVKSGIVGVLKVGASSGPILLLAGASYAEHHQKKLFNSKHRNHAQAYGFAGVLTFMILLNVLLFNPTTAAIRIVVQVSKTALALAGFWLLMNATQINWGRKALMREILKQDNRFNFQVIYPLFTVFQIMIDTIAQALLPSLVSAKSLNDCLAPIVPLSPFLASSLVLLIGSLWISSLCLYLILKTWFKKDLKRLHKKAEKLRSKGMQRYGRSRMEYEELKVRANEKLNAWMKRVHFEATYPEGKLSILYTRFILMKPSNVQCASCLQLKTGNRVPKFRSCKHRMCIPCLRQYIETSSNIAEGTNLECPFEPEICTVLGKNIIEKALPSYHPFLNTVKMKEQLDKAYMRAGLTALQNLMMCPTPDCKNVEFADHALMNEEFINPTFEEFKRQQAEQEKNKKEKEKRRNKQKKMVDPSKIVANWSAIGGEWKTRIDLSSEIKLKVKLVKAGSSMLVYKTYKTNKNGVDLRKFKCSDCNYTSCVVCKKLWTYGEATHEQRTCQEYHRDRMGDEENPEEALTSRKLAVQKKNGHIKSCPNCKTLIEKNQGCRHMNCTQCKVDFCWNCVNVYNQCKC